MDRNVRKHECCRELKNIVAVGMGAGGSGNFRLVLPSGHAVDLSIHSGHVIEVCTVCKCRHFLLAAEAG